MSLINDALKRATGLRKKDPTGPEGMPPLEPVGGKSAGKSKGMTVVLGVVLLAVAGYVGWTYFGPGKTAATTAQNTKGSTNGVKTSAAKSTATADAKAETTRAVRGGSTNNPLARAAAIASDIKTKNDEGATAAEKVNASAAVSPSVANAETSEKPAAPAARTEEKVEPTATPAPVSSPASGSSIAAANFPAVQLQAIYFRSKTPAVVINGKTLREGEEVNGVKVTQIARDEIKLEYQGQSRSLSLK